jgi:hypothetical protein
MTAATYKVLLVKPGGVIKEHSHVGAPPESTLLRWGTSLKAGFVIRYFPSKRGWRLLDVRTAQFFSSADRRQGRWVGHVRGQKYYETEDAAVMVAIHKLG